MLRFRDLGCFIFDLGCFVFEIWVLRASVFVFECFVFETTEATTGNASAVRMLARASSKVTFITDGIRFP